MDNCKTTFAPSCIFEDTGNQAKKGQRLETIEASATTSPTALKVFLSFASEETCKVQPS